MKMPPSTVENQGSSLLSIDENFQVFELLGNRCQTISTTVVQLFLTTPPNHSQWVKKDTGVLCFVKDNGKKNYFFRLFSLRRNQLIWEHEMYNNMDYNEELTYFHTFEGEECMVAFNFANQQEARTFKANVDSKIATRRRKEERKARQITQTQNLKLPERNLDFGAKQEFRREKRKRNITKADIGNPTGFIHISHVGWNPNTGFDVSIEDAQLKALFQKAGVSEKQLQDKETREFIYDFISKHRNSTISGDPNPPVVPPRAPFRPTSTTPRPAPPPPPTHKANSQARKLRPPSPPKQTNSDSVTAAPPPPPPPPILSNVPPPPPPPISSSNGNLPVLSNGNSALLQSIRDGTTLKPVEERRSSPVDDARSDLLSEIRKGIQLKPVDEREIKATQNPSPTSTGNDLAKALKQALLERSKVIHSEDDDDDTSSTSNDDDWDD
ncbi:hypothetical protein ABEB36_002149 [Hypothenemus hampei]|uniref:Neural Wiskott-Aldrich syndrome protein n=1 Tax=Hypothenemus hampei TaxID=57062 RepID=A0ABD1F4Q3_HYPHA